MEGHGERDRIPIVVPSTGAFLEVLVRCPRGAAGRRGRHRDRRLDPPPRSRPRVRRRDRLVRDRRGASPGRPRLSGARRTRRGARPAPAGRPRGPAVAGARVRPRRSWTASRPSTRTTSSAVLPLLAPGAVLAVDNVLMGGSVADLTDTSGAGPDRPRLQPAPAHASRSSWLPPSPRSATACWSRSSDDPGRPAMSPGDDDQAAGGDTCSPCRGTGQADLGAGRDAARGRLPVVRGHRQADPGNRRPGASGRGGLLARPRGAAASGPVADQD